MKKLAVLCMVLVLAFGCATVHKISCNPPESVVAVANTVIAIFLPELAILVPGSAVFSAYITAQNIAAGICISTTQLDELITWLQSTEAQKVQTKSIAKTGLLKAQVINIQPLLSWRATFQ